jgi:type IV secretion system protein VirB5
MSSATQEKTENPFVSARRDWDNKMHSLLSSTRIWQCTAMLSMLVALACVAGMVLLASQSKFIPYVIEVNKLGEASATRIVEKADAADKRVTQAAVASFISSARSVTADISMERQLVLHAKSMLKKQDPAYNKLISEIWGKENNPFERAKKELVSVEIESVLQHSKSTWQVDWKEFVRSHDGELQGSPIEMRALVTTFLNPHQQGATAEQIRQNPLGVYVQDFNWSIAN